MIKKYFYCPIIISLILLLLVPNPAAFAVYSSAADFLFEQAKKYYELEDYEGALRELKKTLLIEPEHAQALTYLQIIKVEMDLLLEEDIDEHRPLLEAESEFLYEEEPSLLELELSVEELAEEVEELAATERVIAPKIDRKGLRPEYILGIGDTISVTVWRNSELNGSGTIRPDGRITLPLIGGVEASGLTPRQLSESIARRHRKYIRDPKVIVFVSSFKSKRILVLGEVRKPGIYQISTPLTALEAVLRAGGHRKNSAVLKSVMIIRNPYSATPQIISADLWSAIYNKRYDKDVALQSGDIVYVPKSFFGKVSDFISLFNSYVRPAAETYFDYDLDFVD